ncbi:hypothetical protein [Streptomyces sp. NPDC005828]|uniref:hypothetical protein n=1 Tax=Streptomyces sp. NPDC005828 TaxID=3157071 RepID=UPI0033E0E5AB
MNDPRSDGVKATFWSEGADGEPSVTWFDVEDESEVPLAGDFRTFVEGLTASAAFDGGQD